MTSGALTAIQVQERFSEKIATPVFSSSRNILFCLAGIVLFTAIWFGIPELDGTARVTLCIFIGSVFGFIFTKADETYIALAAATALVITKVDTPKGLFATLGDSTVWLMIAASLMSTAVAVSGLSHRLTLSILRRVKTIDQLFYGLTLGVLLTAFLIPSTSGRAALMLPVYATLREAIPNKRVCKGLALLFPTTILLSAFASLTGAGAHLVTTDIVRRFGGEPIGFTRWAVLGIPFALSSCLLSTWVILRFFVESSDRSMSVRISAPQTPRDKMTKKERKTLGILAVVVGMWFLEPLHGFDQTIIALLGGLAVTAPKIGVVAFKEGVKKIEWNLIVFLAVTLKLAESLTQSGAAAWIAKTAFSPIDSARQSSCWTALIIIIIASLLSHLFIHSRTARSSALIPLVICLGAMNGLNPTALAFVSTAAAGFCMTLSVCAKPVSIFGAIDGPTYDKHDLLRLSGILFPIHLVMLLAFAQFIWPALGLHLKNEKTVSGVATASASELSENTMKDAAQWRPLSPLGSRPAGK
jgi:solute carrier family 13 (sodium-dependent dicarboxylate transporter), member 2/3/5